MTNLQKIPLREEKSNEKLQETIDDLELHYGTDIIDLISTIDDYQRHYVSSERRLRDLYKAYQDFKNKSNPWAEKVLTKELEKLDFEVQTIESLENDFFDFTQIRNLIGNLSIVFALNAHTRNSVYQDRIKEGEDNNTVFTNKL